MISLVDESQIFSQGCYLDECQWLALVQMESGTYVTGPTFYKISYFLGTALVQVP